MNAKELLLLKKWCQLSQGLVSLDEGSLYISDNAIDGLRLTLDGLGSVGVDGHSMQFDGPLAALDRAAGQESKEKK